MALIVKSAVRDKVKGMCNVGADFLEALDSKVGKLVSRAAERAEANGRKTLKARDV